MARMEKITFGYDLDFDLKVPATLSKFDTAFFNSGWVLLEPSSYVERICRREVQMKRKGRSDKYN